MDPVVLLLIMLKSKEIINENEMSWILHAREMNVDQQKMLSQDGEDRTLTLASMRALSFLKSREMAVSKIKCPYCKLEGTTKEKTIQMPDSPLLTIPGVFSCKDCGKDFI